jgi:hypothetical protein
MKNLFKLLTKKITLSLLAILVIGAPLFYLTVLNQKEAAAWFNENWTYRQKVEITNSGSAQTDFQIQITLDTQTLEDAGKIRSDCNDLRITDTAGKQLPFWIEPTTCSTSATKIWVKVPSISTTGNTLYLYYGNPSAPSAQVSSTSQVFIREISNVQGAWQMDDNVSGDSQTITDASGNGRNGTTTDGANNTGMDCTVSGKFGKGCQFDGADDYLTVANNAVFNMTDTFSIEFWMYTDNISQNYGTMLSKDYGSHYQFNFNGTAGTVKFFPGGSDAAAITSTTVPQGAWVHVVGTYNGSQGLIYINGVQKGTTTVTTPGNSTAITMGADMNHSFPFTGSLDDVRIYNKTLSTTEISDLYGSGGNNQAYSTTNYANKELVRKYSASVTVGSPASEEQGKGPVGLWKFDEGQGTTINDSSSMKNAGTLGVGSSAPSWQPESQCISGKCLLFNGSSTFVQLNSANIINANTKYTIEAWVRSMGSSGRQAIYGEFDTSSNGYTRHYFLIGSNNKIAFDEYLPSGGSITGNTTLSNNTWYHVATVADGSNVTIYVNGKSDGSGAQETFAGNNITVGRIGYRTDSSATSHDPFNGFIDEPKVYPYARTAAEIKADYNAGKANASAHTGSSAVLGSSTEAWLSDGLIGYWKMDDAGIDAEGETITDSSGNSHTGTLYGDNGAGDNGSGMNCTAAGQYGTGCQFDAVDDYVSVTDNASLNPSSEITVSALVKRGAAGSQGMIVGKTGSTTNFAYAMYFWTDNKIYWEISQNGNTSGRLAFVTTNTFSSTTQWYNVVGTFSSGTVKLYVDGVLQPGTTTGSASSIYDDNAALRLGSIVTDQSYWLNGTLDEVRIYNRALSPAEVSNLYNWAPGPVAYYDFEEGGNLGVGSTAFDRSGNNYAGVWAGTGTDHSDNGKFGKGGKFNGTDDYVSLGTNNLPTGSSSPVTLEAWFYATAFSAGRPTIIGYGSGANNQSQDIEIGIGTAGENRVLKLRCNGADFTGNTTIQLNAWNHVVGVDDGTNMKLYLNGVLDNSGARCSTSKLTTYAKIGTDINGDVTNGYFTGNIDDVKIYNYARTQQQIVADMNGGSASIRSVSNKSPVGYWKFDEGQGTVANNSSSQGSTLNGTLTSMASPATSTSGWTQSGKFGKALVFDGTNDYISITDPGASSALDMNGQITISTWIKTSGANNYAGIIHKSNNSSTGYQLGMSTSSDIRADLFKGTTYDNVSTSGLNVEDNLWHSIIATYDGSTAIIYVDGVKKASKAMSGYLQTNSNDNSALLIGNDDGAASRYFNGSIDEVKVYNYALTADEVKQDYNKGASLVLGTAGNNSSYAAGAANQEYCIPGDSTSCAAPVARWDFEEGKDNTCSGGTNDVCDTSGSGYNGAWNGTGSHWIQGKSGKGGKFNGSDDYIATGNYNESANQAFSASAWIKLNATQNATGVFGHKINGQSGWLFGIGTTNNKPALYTGTTGGYLDAASAIPVGQWTHLEVTYDGTNRNIYINGQLSAGPSAGSFGANNIPFTIGRFHSDESANHFNGQIDQVRYFNYARSAAQVAYDYNKGGPVGYWKFDECQGSVAHDSADLTAGGSGNNGTITIGASGEDTLGTCTTSSTAWGSGATGKRNASLSFDETDDYVDVGSNSITGTNAYTLSAWVKGNTMSTYGGALGIGNGATGQLAWIGWVTTAQVGTNNSWGGGGYSENYGSGITDISNWHHLVLTSSGGATQTLNLYVDGVLKTTHSETFNLASTSKKIGVLDDNGTKNYWYNGQIDDVKVFNYALTASQVKNEYNGGAVYFGPSTGSP